MYIKHIFAFAVIIVCPVASGYAQQKPKVPPNNQTKAVIDKTVTPLLAGTNALQGLVVGVVQSGKKEVWGYGKLGTDGRTPDGDTLFRVLSVSKPLTALLLAQLSVEGKLNYDGVAIRLKEKPVTFRQLVTHTSGLTMRAPNLPENSIAGLRSFLNEYSLDREPGNRFEYSTLGFGALGMSLGEKCESHSFENCLREKVLSPLGMSSSVFELPAARRARYAGEFLPTARKDGPNPFNASGGLISSAHDLLQLVSANLNAESRPKLAKAIRLTQQTDPKIKAFPGSIGGLGWFLFEPANVYWYSGIGSDFKAFIAFDLQSDCGLVILTKPGLPPSDTRIEIAGFSLLGTLAGLKPNAEK